MSAMQAPAGELEISVATVVSDALAETIAEVTRAAYARGDLVPGLPAADGARATADEVRADLAAGLRLITAYDRGVCVGAVRAAALNPHTWEVRRLAVAPGLRHGGTGRRLLRRLEAEAWAAGATRVTLDAVVERGNPAFYTRVGYHTVRHFPNPDKPLSEVHMQRLADAADEPLVYPQADTTGDQPGVAVTWWAVPTGTVCRISESRDGPLGAARRDRASLPATARPVGADFWAGAAAAELRAVRAEVSAGAAQRHYPAPAATVSAFAQPRLRCPQLLAWWRDPGVRHG
ncbi:GNAT family N-acetyltransferase [Actinoplanes sp. NEAU-A12]|uniref:GNAT family N-acetyltransferase n=1 Tax=Actinoplanes sandaracinus TaxID=3045177 RepID=A0ABT6WTH0_9ACTN|nr:GNAT family N-acetyltransferase [Actinoplanes sandaracinus]MDI6102994.1 GNAT family N-acetyltransferase [Actinoplanes sandaracinus]